LHGFGKRILVIKRGGETCLGEVLLALGGAVNDTANGVFANIIHLSLDTGSLLLLGDA
jgi:hypothetical protein